ncbi:MAG TPA: N-acetylmuramoyl-L-alanine amidase [Bacteroidales bacterium]|nr:N-acetylmuramoyl-L-alanine amidase [Bacteroidales bacterium]
MTTEGKNGKQHAINIYSIVNIFILFVLSCLSGANTAFAQQKQWVVVIDAGHGGRDPGAVGSFSHESDINLAIALKTGEYLEKNVPNVRIVYTRKDNSTVDLYERPRIANSNNADLFISIHTNKTGSKTVMGSETYIMGLTKDEANLAVAMKENEVMLLEDDYSTKYQGFDPKSPDSYIMFMVMHKEYQKQSLNLANKIQTQFTEKLNRKDRSVKQAGFWVLFNTAMPSVLVETGFISNPAEEKFLNSKLGQDYLASAIFRACKEYIEEINRRSVVLTTLEKDTTITATTLATSVTRPVETVFMVQISSSKDKTVINPENFKGLKDIAEITSQGRFRYASGSFNDYQEAIKYRKEIKNIYPDAFVIAVRNNEIVPLQQALTQSKNK